MQTDINALIYPGSGGSFVGFHEPTFYYIHQNFLFIIYQWQFVGLHPKLQKDGEMEEAIKQQQARLPPSVRRGRA